MSSTTAWKRLLRRSCCGGALGWLTDALLDELLALNALVDRCSEGNFDGEVIEVRLDPNAPVETGGSTSWLRQQPKL